MRSALATVGAAVLAVAVPATASAASLSTVHRCYVNADPTKGTPILITGSGYTPGDTIDLQTGGIFTTATVNSAGKIRAVVTGPTLNTVNPKVGHFTVTATDETTGGVVAHAPLTVANLSFQLKPSSAVTSARVSYSFSGFLPGRVIYGHYVHNGHNTATVRFGRTTGPCGTLKTRARFFPQDSPRYVNYTLQFDDSRRYSKRALPRIVTKLRF